ncbi:MAG: hypothetical protein AAGH19_09115 [Pseudomonadota bacterium]
MNTRNRNRLILVALFVLFLIPLVAAILLQPEQLGEDPLITVNRGDLVTPPVPMNPAGLAVRSEAGPAALERRWLLVHPIIDGCDARCESVITDLRQVHIGTGRYQDKVAVLLLATETLPASEAERLSAIYERLVIATDPTGGTRTALLAANKGIAPASGTTFVADPEGNLMLHYAPGYARGDLNKDLKKLLKWSGR